MIIQTDIGAGIGEEANQNWRKRERAKEPEGGKKIKNREKTREKRETGKKLKKRKTGEKMKKRERETVVASSHLFTLNQLKYMMSR